MSKFFNFGNSLINAEHVTRVELNEDQTSIGLTYEDGKYVYKSFPSKDEAEAAYSEIKAVLCGVRKTKSYAVSYFYGDDFSGKGIGLDVFGDVREKLTGQTVKRFAEAIEKAHGATNVSVLGVIPLQG